MRAPHVCPVWRFALVMLGASLLAACDGGPPSAAPASTAAAPTGVPVTVRLGYFPNVTHAAALVGIGRGMFQESLGPNVRLDTKTFNAGPALIEAMFAGEVDIAYIGPNPAINGYVKSKGDALRIVAGATSGGAALLVRPEASITGPQDLAGKKLATPQLGNTQDVALRYYLQQNGLQTADKGGTVQIVPTQNPDILRLFQQGQIDGAWVPEPWAARLILEGKGKVFVDERDLWPNGRFVTTNIIASRKFLDAHSDIVTNFLKGHIDAITFLTSDPEQAKQIVNREIERITMRGLPPEVIDAAFKTMEATYDPLAATLFVSADHAFALGFLGDTKPDLGSIYDLRPLNEALQARGLATIARP